MTDRQYESREGSVSLKNSISHSYNDDSIVVVPQFALILHNYNWGVKKKEFQYYDSTQMLQVFAI
ncbi:MAG: hypothetical protein GY861_15360 [bacterium]|nr:hypothetical protein [bacterium]